MAMLNQIMRCLKKPKIWRLLCLASSVVGLVCYALSSSFNPLFGKWSWWKMFLYSVFSFIICLAIFFSPARSRSTSLRLEAHLAFLVLIITSVYSLLFDNEVKGKPDAYSVISYAAFATMSLGLSNLTQFGFQIDLLYFFCGGLTVQLMKIKLWLVIVGGGFSYSLFQLRDYPHDTQGENLSHDTQGENLMFQVQNQVIIQVDDSESVSSSSHVIMSQQANAVVDGLGTSPENGNLTFQDHLVTQSNSHSQDGSVDEGLIIGQQLMNCIKELEKEKQMIVGMVCSHVDKYLKAVFDSKDKDEDQNQMLEVPDPDVYLVMYALPSGIRRRLKETVKLMVEAGFEEECSDIYSKWRREFVEQCLWALGLQFQMPNNEGVEKWMKTCKAAGKILFPNEWRLCDYLFSGFSVVAHVSFEKVCEEVMNGVVRFVDTTIRTESYLPNLLLEIVPKMMNSLSELKGDFIKLNLVNKLSLVDKLEETLALSNKSRNTAYPNNVEAAGSNNRGLHPITNEAINSNIRISSSKIEERADRNGRPSRVRALDSLLQAGGVTASVTASVTESVTASVTALGGLLEAGGSLASQQILGNLKKFHKIFKVKKLIH